MTKLKLLSSSLFLWAVGCIFFGSANAQQTTLSVAPSGRPVVHNLSLAGDDKRKMFFTVATAGPVKGRVFGDAELVNNVAEEYGIAGVKVTLGAVTGTFVGLVFEQYTNNFGVYYFEDLQPGRYYIEIDPADLPVNFRRSKLVSPQ